ncbi:MAG: molybdenum cofactor guanylyltransferase [Desulfobacteraceae bacterium]
MTDRLGKIDCCAMILAGGLNTRMAGRNKAFLEVGGQSILSRLLKSLQTCFDEIVLVTRQPELYTDYPVRVVEDIYPYRSSLTGIHAGLVNAKAFYTFVVPCDTPFLQPGLIRLLLDQIQPSLDIVVPYYDNHFQPLCSIYSKRCLPAIESQLDQEDYKIINIFDRMRTKRVTARELKQADPQMLSFYNVNTPDAYEACRNLIQD